MKKIVLLSVVFLFLGGCTSYKVGSEYMTLNEALAQARKPYVYDVRDPTSSLYLSDLESLKRQTSISIFSPGEEDDKIINQKIDEYKERIEHIRRQLREEDEQEQIRPVQHPVQRYWEARLQQVIAKQKQFDEEQFEKGRIGFEKCKLDLIIIQVNSSR